MDRNFFAAFVGLMLTAGMAFAQGKGKSKGGALRIQGEMLPVLTAFDENGAEFPLTQKLKGKHGVLVFGCLT